MTTNVDLRVLELLCGRLCHELISPVGAINNGVELLDEEDPDFVKEAMTLIGQSARKAGQRLQFYRFAYGTAGGGESARIDAAALCTGLLEGGKVTCWWTPEAASMPLASQRLACNMLVLAADALPRGGTVTVGLDAAGQGGITVAAEGETVSDSVDLRAMLGGAVPDAALTARNVHAFFAQRLAERLGLRLALEAEGPHRLRLIAASG